MTPLKIKVCGMRDAQNIADLLELPIDYIGFIFYEKSPRYVESIKHLTPQLINSDKFKKINKTGVFVNAEIDFVLDKITQFGLNTIQLHGKETPQYVIDLRIKIDELISDKLKLAINNNELNINELALIDNNLALNKIKTELIALKKKSELITFEDNSELINYNSIINIWKAFSVDEHFNFDETTLYEQLADAFLFDTKTPQHGGSGQKFNWDLLQNYQGTTPFFLSGGISASDTEGVRLFTHSKFSGLDLNSKFEKIPAFKDIELLKNFIQSVCFL